MRVFLNDGCILEGKRRLVEKAIRSHKKIDPFIKVKFSGPFSDLDVCLYDLRSGNIKWATEHNTRSTLEQAYHILALERGCVK